MDYQEFCSQFYAATYVPVSYMRFPQTHVCSFPQEMESLHRVQTKLSRVITFSKNPDYYVTATGAYFGFVSLDHSESTMDYLIIGPIFSSAVTEDVLAQYLREIEASADYAKEIGDFTMATPCLSLHQFLNALSFLHLVLNEKKIDIMEHFHIHDATAVDTIAAENAHTVYNKKEAQQADNSYLYEMELLSCVREGKTARLDNMLSQSNSQTALDVRGQMQTLSEERHTFVTLASIVCRAAITGGLSTLEAYSLSDTYIREADRIQSREKILRLEVVMLRDYTHRVSLLKVPGSISREIFNCIQYVDRHTNDRIQVSDVAESVNRSRSYISRKFKQETGEELSAYITRCKLEEAKNLLRFSDRSLSEISEYLCFSTQSYFQNLFKKEYGVTPMQFRKQKRPLDPRDN